MGSVSVPHTEAVTRIINTRRAILATKIRLKRQGKKFYAFYRVVISDSRNKRDGQSIEEIGIYDPNKQPSLIQIDSERAQYWLGVGAQPSEAVFKLLNITGDWQKFKAAKSAAAAKAAAEAEAAKADEAAESDPAEAEASEAQAE